MEYKIYQIVCNETDEVYIGKTTQTLGERLRQHRLNSNSTNSKQIILRGDYVMSQIDECDTEEESIELEAFYIRNTDNCVNINIPGRTKKEYYEENKDEILIKRKEYYDENKDEITIRKKKYREENIDKVKEQDKKYYEENKDKILIKNEERSKVKYTCKCGSIIRKDSKAKHEKTLIHLNYINSK